MLSVNRVFKGIWDERSAMRRIRYLILGWMALVVVSCGGEVYEDYGGPDADVEEIAILDWSSCEKCSVIRIDDNRARRVRGEAYLSPGPHTITVGTYYEDLNVCVHLDADFHQGRSYIVKQAACFRCSPFEAGIRMEDKVSGEIIAQEQVFGTGPYGEMANEIERCVDDCLYEERRWDRLYPEDSWMPSPSCSQVCGKGIHGFDCVTRDGTGIVNFKGVVIRKTRLADVVDVKIPLREVQDGQLLATVKVNDQRPPELATSTREAMFGVSLGTITFDPPEVQIVKNLLEVELTKILRDKGVQSEPDLVCDIVQFRVHNEVTLLYWDVVSEIQLFLTHNGKKYDLSGQSTKRTYIWPGRKIIKAVVGDSLNEIAADLKQHHAGFQQGP